MNCAASLKMSCELWLVPTSCNHGVCEFVCACVRMCVVDKKARVFAHARAGEM